MSETHNTEYALLGQPVRVSLSQGKDTYYGTLESADAAFVVLVNMTWGWWGSAGWWPHGKSERGMIPTSGIIAMKAEEAP